MPAGGVKHKTTGCPCCTRGGWMAPGNTDNNNGGYD